MKALNVIGLNSGTSMDGVDAAIFHLRPAKNTSPNSLIPAIEIEMRGCLLYEFDPVFRKNMQAMIARGFANLDQICRLNAALGEIFAAAARAAVRKARMSMSEIDLVGSHGQTVWHSPGSSKLWGMDTRSTLQLGEADIIARQLQLPVIADFRTRDLAYGGQGAPLVAFADEVIFARTGIATGVLNIGGIANITAISSKGQALMAFDTGPGNMLMDRACQQLFDCEFDREGLIAAAGKVDRSWLDKLLLHPYFSSLPPKTTGREVFGYQFADNLLDQAQSLQLNHKDCLSTITALTASSIAAAYKRFISPELEIKQLVLGGGGACNRTLTGMLQEYWPGKVDLKQHEDFGISTKFKESLLFALLAYTTHFGIPNNVPACTGAKSRVCLGKFSFP